MSYKMEPEVANLIAGTQANFEKPTAFRLNELEEFLKRKMVPVESVKNMMKQHFQEKFSRSGLGDMAGIPASLSEAPLRSNQSLVHNFFTHLDLLLSQLCPASKPRDHIAVDDDHWFRYF